MVTELHAGRDEATENLKTKQKVEASHCMATTGCEAEINTSVQEGSEGEGISKSSTHDGDAWNAGKRKVTFAPMRSVYSTWSRQTSGTRCTGSLTILTT